MPVTSTPITTKSLERNGWTNFARMANSIMEDLTDLGTITANSGFEVIYPASGIVTQEGAAGGFTAKCVLQSTYKVDPLSPDSASDIDTTMTVGTGEVPMQPYRILIDASEITPSDTDHGAIRIYLGTSIQISDTGIVSEEAKEGAITRHSGELSCGVDTGKLIPFLSYKFADATLIGPAPNDAQAAMGSVKAHPFSYRLTITNRGFGLVIWKEASDDYGNRFSWLVVQRLVSYDDGTITNAMKSGRSPVFCLYSIGGGNPLNCSTDPIQWTRGGIPSELRNSVFGAVPYFNTDYSDSGVNMGQEQGPGIMRIPRIFRFTVRERDVLRPTVPVNACLHTVDNNAVINPYQQVATYEDGKYVVNMPQNFNTDRYVYKDVMDLIAYTASDVVPQWTEVSLANIFGTKTYKYMAMHANIANNNGMRILLLTSDA